MNKTFFLSCIAARALFAGSATAGEKEELVKLRETVGSLLDALVEEGVLSRDKARALVQRAEKKGAEKAAEERRKAKATEESVSEAEAAGPAVSKETGRDEVGPGVVRVPYVPEFGKKEIREQVRNELRQDVVKDVVAQAKNEKWGIPAALPDWISKIKWTGDWRLREQYESFADSNAPFIFDPRRVNAAESIAGDDLFLNSTEDRNRLRARLRFGMEVNLTDSFKTGFRITTDNEANPVSTQQTLGNYGRRFEVSLDTAYLDYTAKNAEAFPWLTMSLGRFFNPFVRHADWPYREMVWDEDLNFEGAAITYRHRLAGSDSLLDLYDRSRSLALTLGAFPIQEVSLSEEDKWLIGGQAALDWTFENQSKVLFSVGYFDYRDIEGRTNDADLMLTDFTAPLFLQKGNTLFNIRNSTTDPNEALLALASDYNLLNISAMYDVARFAPAHVMFMGDVVKNLGFDRDEIFRRTGGALFTNTLSACSGKACIEERTLGYQLQLAVGWPRVQQWGHWQAFGGYKHVERDAVLDAFTDSNFNGGGTDTEGWYIGGLFGITKNVWLRVRYFNGHEIEDQVINNEDGTIRDVDGPPFSVDILQLDLNARFF